MARHAAVLALSALALAACSQQKTEDQPAAPPALDEVRTPAVAPAVPAPVTAAPNDGPPDGGTVGGDGSEIQLSGLTQADLQANRLEGELGCGFRSGGGTDPLLHALGYSGIKEPAHGLVKVGGYVERVVAPGGYDAMVNGATFNGQGKVIRIAITGKPIGGGESPPYPATLTYQRADGAERVFTGTWTCGP